MTGPRVLNPFADLVDRETNPFDDLVQKEHGSVSAPLSFAPTVQPPDALGSIRSRVPHASAAPEVTARASVAATPAPEVTPTPAPIETAAPPTAPPSKPVAGVPYIKNGHSVIDTDNADAKGHVPTHRLDQPTNRQPGESFPDYEARVLARTSWSPDTAAVSSLDALDPSVEPSVKQLMDAAAAAGHRITPDETRRTQERQEMLFQRGRTPGSGPKPATWTLTSDHTPGRAVDFSGDPSAYEWLQENAPKFGFSVMGDMDPGHVAMPEPADANAPGPFAEENAKAFVQAPQIGPKVPVQSTKLERATTSGRDATVTPATAPAPSGMSAARALGINDAVDPTTGRAPLLARAANAVNEMVAHPGNTAAGFVTAPLEALWTAQKEATQQNERASFATAGLDPDSVRQMVQPRDAAAAAAQLGALALGPLADIGMSAAAKPLIGSIGNAFGETAADVAGRAAAAGIHGTTGAGIGAAFSPTDPAVGALVGGATGAVPTAILGGRVTPNIREGTPDPANLADHPDRLLGRRTPPPRARAKIDFTPEAPSGSPFDVEMNTIDEALGRKPTPAAPQQMTAEELQQRRNAEEALAAKAQQSPPIDLSLPPRVGRDPFERPGLADMEIGPKNGKPAPPKLSIIEQLKRAAAPADELSKGVNPFDEIEQPAVSHSSTSSDVAKQETSAAPTNPVDAFLEKEEPAQKAVAPIPEWVKQNVQAYVGDADRAGISDEIEKLSADRLTAKEIRDRLGSRMPHLDDTDKLNVIRAVRGARGIPGMDDREAFEQWRANRVQAPGQPAPESVQAPGPVAEKPKHDYSSTQVDLPLETAAAIHQLGAQIPDEHLAADGRENTPHVTLKYGLHGDNVDAVRKALENEPPITAKLGKTSLFQNDDADVLKVDVDSPDLHRLNKKIAELPHTDTHPDYVPHATVAYLKPGQGKQYAGDASLEGHSVTLNHVTFSDRNGNTTDIPLTGQRAATYDARESGGPSKSPKDLGFTAERRTPALPTEFDTPEVHAARARELSIGPTNEIRTPEREAWREREAVALDNGTKLERRADIVMGLPGSGKTSTQVDPLVREHGASLLDSDIVKRNAPEWNDGAGATALHPESTEVRTRAMTRAVARGANIVFPTVGDPRLTPGLVHELQSHGYTVHAHFVDVPPEEAARRVVAGFQSGGRHFVDPDAILRRGDQPRRGFAAVADIPGVIAHEPVSNHVPRGEAPRPVTEWRREWGLERASDAALPVLQSEVLRSGRPGRAEADDQSAAGASGAKGPGEEGRRSEVAESPDRPAESGDRVSGNDVHEFSTSGSTPRAKARPIKPDGSVGSVADKTPLPDATGLEQERSSLRLRELLPSLRALFHPEGLSAGAKGTAGTIRHENAVSFHDLAVANERLREFGRRFGKLKKADAVKYWDAAERGVDTGDAVFDHGAKLLQEVTKKFTDELIALDRLKADAAIANYIGRYWDTSANNGGKVTDFLHRVLGKRPFEGPKSWQKHRSFEFFKEGLDAGLTPATYNYVDSQLAKIAEMQRVIAAERMLRAEQTFGRAKRVMLGKEAPIDEDGNPWVRIGDGSDPAFTVYAPPTTTVHEAFDAGVRKGLEQAIERLDNLKHTRAVSVGRKKLGWAKVSGDEIASKFGSHDGVIMHELGHILDTRYPLRAKLAKVPATEDELKALADLRFEHSVHASKKFKAYVREPAEQMANALHALIHAPELMQKVAPNTKRIITDYLKSRRELAPILDIKPSLSLETGRAEQRLPGPVLAGFWYAPKASAAVWSNFLSRGWRGNPLYDALLAPAQASTQILLGLSGFHATTIATEGMFSDLALAVDHLANGGSKAEAMKSVLRAPAAPFRMSVKGRKVMQEYRAPGTHPELARVLDAMIQGGYRGTAQLEYINGDRLKKLKKAFADAVEGQSAGRRLWGATRLPLDALWAGVEIPTQFLMGRYVPWMKTAATYELTARELAKLPQTATMDDVHRVLGDVVKEMDLRFGQVTYENWFVHNAAKHLAQLVFLAPGWTFGTATLTGRGVRDVAQIAPRGAKAIGRAGRRFAGQDVPEGTPEPLIGKSAAYWIGAVLGTMLINAWLTRAHTGEDPHGKDFFAYRDGTKDADGNPNRHRIPGYLMHDVYGYGTHPVDLFKNKLSPTLAFLERAVANKDYFGDMLYDPQASPAVKAKQLGTAAAKELATPLSAQNFLEDKQRGEHGAGDMVRDAFGVTPAKREFVRTDAQNLMAEFLARQGHTARTPTEVDSARGRADVFRDYREGTRSKGDIIQLERAGELTQGQGKSIIRRAREEGLVTKFKQLTADEAEKVFAVGTDEERQLWWPWMLRKRGAARRERAFRHGVSSDRP